MDNREKGHLYGMMRACGHFLYHRSGSCSGQGKILTILADKGSMTQKELQEMLYIKSGSVSEILTKLEEKGLILRKKQEEDKRRIVLELTDEGQKAVREQRKKNEEEKLFQVLDEREQEELEGLLAKLLESWKDM